MEGLKHFRSERQNILNRDEANTKKAPGTEKELLFSLFSLSIIYRQIFFFSNIAFLSLSLSLFLFFSCAIILPQFFSPCKTREHFLNQPTKPEAGGAYFPRSFFLIYILLLF